MWVLVIILNHHLVWDSCLSYRNDQFISFPWSHFVSKEILTKYSFKHHLWTYLQEKSQYIDPSPLNSFATDIIRLRAREEGATEDEMVGWHHWLNGHEFEQAPGDGEESMGLQRVGHDLATEQQQTLLHNEGSVLPRQKDVTGLKPVLCLLTVLGKVWMQNDDTWGTSLAVQWLRPELLLRELGFHFWSVN